MASSDSPTPRPAPAYFAWPAIAAPVIGYAIGLLVAPPKDGSWGLAAMSPFLLGACPAALIGTLFVIAAALRREPRGLVVIAILVCTPLAALFLAVVLL